MSDCVRVGGGVTDDVSEKLAVRVGTGESLADADTDCEREELIDCDRDSDLEYVADPVGGGEMDAVPVALEEEDPLLDSDVVCDGDEETERERVPEGTALAVCVCVATGVIVLVRVGATVALSVGVIGGVTDALDVVLRDGVAAIVLVLLGVAAGVTVTVDVPG